MAVFMRTTNVSLAQRYWNFEWDQRLNHAAYGTLASIDGVGANLRVQIKSVDERDLQPGLVLVKRMLDHRALFEDEPRFERAPSTLEAITHWVGLVLGEDLGVSEVSVFDGPALRCRSRTSGPSVDVSERIGNITITQTTGFDHETGLGVIRGLSARALRKVAPQFARPFDGSPEAWGRALRDELARELPKLSGLAIDHGARGVQYVHAGAEVPQFG